MKKLTSRIIQVIVAMVPGGIFYLGLKNYEPNPFLTYLFCPLGLLVAYFNVKNEENQRHWKYLMGRQDGRIEQLHRMTKGNGPIQFEEDRK